MIRQTELGTTHFSQLRELIRRVETKAVTVGGNSPGKIYGRLGCRAGKRMDVRNRVFFRDEAEAVQAGFRPCAVCLPEAYKSWKEGEKSV